MVLLIMSPAESALSSPVQYSMIRSVPTGRTSFDPDCTMIFHGNYHQLPGILGLKYLTINIKMNPSNHKLVLLDSNRMIWDDPG